MQPFDQDGDLRSLAVNAQEEANGTGANQVSLPDSILFIVGSERDE
jgi:hypothetical protein